MSCAYPSHTSAWAQRSVNEGFIGLGSEHIGNSSFEEDMMGSWPLWGIQVWTHMASITMSRHTWAYRIVGEGFIGLGSEHIGILSFQGHDEWLAALGHPSLSTHGNHNYVGQLLVVTLSSKGLREAGQEERSWSLDLVGMQVCDMCDQDRQRRSLRLHWSTPPGIMIVPRAYNHHMVGCRTRLALPTVSHMFWLCCKSFACVQEWRMEIQGRRMNPYGFLVVGT